jgi:hypothetical protein
MSKVTVSEYAKRRGIHERSVRRYLADGFIPTAAQIREGRLLFIDQEMADQALSKHATTRKELLPPSKKIQAVEKAGTAGLSFQDARTLTQRYKAALLRLELDEKTGRLMDVEQVKISAFNKAKAVRDTLLNIPDRISPILAAEVDPVRVSEILILELKTALEDLSQ